MRTKCYILNNNLERRINIPCLKKVLGWEAAAVWKKRILILGERRKLWTLTEVHHIFILSNWRVDRGVQEISGSYYKFGCRPIGLKFTKDLVNLEAKPLYKFWFICNWYACTILALHVALWWFVPLSQISLVHNHMYQNI